MSISATAVIHWCGWETTLEKLQQAGWTIDERSTCFRCNSSNHFFRLNNRLILRNKKACVVATLSYVPSSSSKEQERWELTALVHRKQYEQVPPFILDERNLTQEDIPALLEIILELQKEYPKPKPRQLPLAEIIFLKERSVNG